MKYVALLAFNKIVVSHPYLVSVYQDIIMDCIDDADISIRLQALDLGSGMINGDNLNAVINRLLRQLREAVSQGGNTRITSDRTPADGIEPAADSDGEDPEQTLRSSTTSPDNSVPVPDEYRVTVIRQILSMCSRNTYANITDFEWYVEVLVELVRLVPLSTKASAASSDYFTATGHNVEVSTAIGAELRNVAVRVSAVRADAVRAAGLLLSTYRSQNFALESAYNGSTVLAYAAWIVGEYADLLPNRRDTLDCLLLPTLQPLGSEVISAYIQAIPKIFASIITEVTEWSAEWQTIYSLLLGRIIHSLQQLTTHPTLEVQERSVEFLELMRLAAEAVKNHESQDGMGPHLLTHIIPSLFNEAELNPVAATAQRKVPLPDGIDLTNPISERLTEILLQAEGDPFMDKESAESKHFYYERASIGSKTDVGIGTSSATVENSRSYQRETEAILDPKVMALKRAERRERNKDDPFYIAHSDDNSSGATTPSHDTLRSSNGHDLDVDSIPIMNLDLGSKYISAYSSEAEIRKPKRRDLQKVHVAADENINDSDAGMGRSTVNSVMTSDTVPTNGSRQDKAKRALLEVDSSGIRNLRLDGDLETGGSSQSEYERQKLEESEMAKAMVEVERLRLQMQRAAERIQMAEDIPTDGTLVKKKTKKKKDRPTALAIESLGIEIESPKPEDAVVKRKKKKKKAPKIPDEDPAARADL